MKLSIITPSYNQGQFIERTILSVLSQNYPNLEYIVMDGGSTDETVNILKRYQERLTWVSEKDDGQAHAVNKGIDASHGDIIGWLNSDDIYYPDAFLKVIDFFNNHSQIDILYGYADHIDVDDHHIEDYPTEPWNFARLKDTCFICQPTVFFRRRVFQSYGLLQEDLAYCMDYEYWLRLGKKGVVFGLLETKLAASRFYESTKTLGARKKVHNEINDMMKQTFGTVPLRWIVNYAHVQLEDKNREQKTGTWHKLKLLYLSIRSSYRWNKKIHKDLLEMFFTWFVKV